MRITLDFADKPTPKTRKNEDGTVRQGQILEVNKKKACVANGDYMCFYIVRAMLLVKPCLVRN